MKIFRKLKKILMGVGTFVITMPIKVMAANYTNLNVLVEAQPAYGVRKLEFPRNAYDFARVFILPIIMVIGIIMYWKKSESKKIEKVLTVVAIIVLFIILSFFIDFLIEAIV